MAKQHKIVVVEDAVLTSMAHNSLFTNAFPFLAGLRGRTKARSGGCCRRNQPGTTSVFNSAKKAVAGMTSERLRQLKTMLDTEQIRVIYKDRHGKIVNRLI